MNGLFFAHRVLVSAPDDPGLLARAGQVVVVEVAIIVGVLAGQDRQVGVVRFL